MIFWLLVLPAIGDYLLCDNLYDEDEFWEVLIPRSFLSMPFYILSLDDAEGGSLIAEVDLYWL